MNQANQHVDILCKNSSEIVPPAGHYSHVCVAGDQVFISGQLPIQQDGTPLSDASFEEQAHQVLENLDACLACVGLDKTRLTQVRIYVTEISNWPLFNEIYASWLDNHRPARAVAGVKELHFGAAVEIEATAVMKKTL
ncbi:RidA family protein [Halomonas sp. MCCC 1A11036]|uniref:RidA family protein n=1 Tax=Billgrantia zhangzhouensis TaxID=2733481 RepID=A0ABS9AIM3_9GAMM|nr:RidA family protein [Halomonas zhangzhouensis]MCE8021602.1 RidA family protein [Halomonas zhangzhouensis]